MQDYAIIINTHSSCKEIWGMLLGQIKKYSTWENIYIFSDVNSKIFENYKVILYDNVQDFRTQYLSCLKQVPEQFCINMNDDYILYDTVNEFELKRVLSIIKTNEAICQIRFLRGFNNTDKKFADKIYYLDGNQQFFYSQVMSLWRTRVLEKIHELCPPSGIGRKNNELQLEVVANLVCRKLRLEGLYYYDNEPKRGAYHYDSNLIPHIASALVAGRWNISEYRSELTPLFTTYKINPGLRGTC